jgi:uncharacterized membrane protein YfcA
VIGSLVGQAIGKLAIDFLPTWALVILFVVLLLILAAGMAAIMFEDRIERWQDRKAEARRKAEEHRQVCQRHQAYISSLGS